MASFCVWRVSTSLIQTQNDFFERESSIYPKPKFNKKKMKIVNTRHEISPCSLTIQPQCRSSFSSVWILSTFSHLLLFYRFLFFLGSPQFFLELDILYYTCLMIWMLKKTVCVHLLSNFMKILWTSNDLLENIFFS